MLDTVPYLTGGVSTKGKFTFQYGKIETKAMLESATSAWPAIWMLTDQQLGGSWVGKVDPKDLPVQMIVDWVKIYN